MHGNQATDDRARPWGIAGAPISRRRFLRAASGVAATTASLAALGAAPRRSPTSVTLYSFMGQGDFEAGFNGWVQDQVRQFQKDHPYIKVTVAGKDSNDQAGDLRTNLEAGLPMDICIIDAAIIPAFARSGDLINLDRFPDFGDIQQAYMPAYMGPVTYRGRVYGLPLGAQPYVMMGNHTLLGRESMPRTWAEFVRVAREHTSAQNNVYGYAFPGGGGSDTSDHFAAWLFSSGARVLSPEGDEPVFNGPGGVGALQMLVDLVRQGVISPDASSGTSRDSLGSFIRNEAALDCDGPFVQRIMDTYGAGSGSLEVGPMPMAAPSLEPNAPATLVSMGAMAMTSTTRAPMAAWTLLTYLRAAKADAAFASGAMIGLPVTRQAYTGGVRWSLHGKDAYRITAQSVQPWPAVAVLDVVQTQLATAVSAALARQKTPKAALDAAARAVAAALAPPPPKRKRKAAHR